MSAKHTKHTQQTVHSIQNRHSNLHRKR